MRLETVNTSVVFINQNTVEVSNNDFKIVVFFKPQKAENEFKEHIQEIFVNNIYYSYYLETLNDIVVLDIGMNRGLASLYFARMDNVKKVYSYEPAPTIFGWAIENFENNKQYSKKIIPHNYGLASKDNDIEVTYDLVVSGATVTVQSIPRLTHIADKITEKVYLKEAKTEIQTIIDENPNSPIVLKIDCEGAEFEILENITEEQFQKIKYIAGEYHHLSFRNAYNRLVKLGFEVLMDNKPKMGLPFYGNFFAYRK